MVHIQLKMVTTSTTYNSRLSHIGDILKNLNVRESLIAVHRGQRMSGRTTFLLFMCIFWEHQPLQYTFILTLNFLNYKFHKLHELQAGISGDHADPLYKTYFSIIFI